MKTLFIGQRIIEQAILPSTNSFMSDLLKQSKIFEGLVVWALEQSNGKGQRGNYWESEKNKNLTISIALFPSFIHTANCFQLNKIISLGVADFISRKLKQHKALHEEVKIKWPNDILVNNKKIAGVLIENNIRGFEIMSSIVGIGININQIEFPNNLSNATSLKIFTKENYDLRLCLEELCSFIEARYLQLKSLKFNDIDKDYKSLLYKNNMWSSYWVEKVEVVAKIIDISLDGKLILEFENGEKKKFGVKEIGHKFTD